jgi:hypothetical protein
MMNAASSTLDDFLVEGAAQAPRPRSEVLPSDLVAPEV